MVAALHLLSDHHWIAHSYSFWAQLVFRVSHTLFLSPQYLTWWEESHSCPFWNKRTRTVDRDGKGGKGKESSVCFTVLFMVPLWLCHHWVPRASPGIGGDSGFPFMVADGQKHMVWFRGPWKPDGTQLECVINKIFYGFDSERKIWLSSYWHSDVDCRRLLSSQTHPAKFYILGGNK
jgi:hypothetical protein